MIDFDEVIHVDPGNDVICDICGDDYTNSEESGGYIFSSYAYCPGCADRGMKSIKKHNEEKYIKATCPPDMSFADWIRSIR